MTVGELSARITAEEFALWLGFWRLRQREAEERERQRK